MRKWLSALFIFCALTGFYVPAKASSTPGTYTLRYGESMTIEVTETIINVKDQYDNLISSSYENYNLRFSGTTTSAYFKDSVQISGQPEYQQYRNTYELFAENYGRQVYDLYKITTVSVPGPYHYNEELIGQYIIDVPPEGKLPAPVATKPSGTYDLNTIVGLSCDMEGSSVCFTCGTEEETAAMEKKDYNNLTVWPYPAELFSLTQDTVVRAYATKFGYEDSDIATFRYNISRYRLTMVVRDKYTQEPLFDAEIKLGYFDTLRTNLSGMAVFSAQNVTDLDLNVTKQGYAPWNGSYHLAEQAGLLYIDLEPLPDSISLSVNLGGSVSFYTEGPKIDFMNQQFPLFPEMEVGFDLPLGGSDSDMITLEFDPQTQTYKGTLSTEGEAENENVKFEKAKSAVKSMNKNRLRLLSGDLPGKLGVNGSYSCVGYVEARKLPNGEIRIVTGELVFSFGAGASLTYPFPSFPLAYCKFAVEGSADGNLKLSLTDSYNWFDGATASGHLLASLEPSVGVGLGVSGLANLEVGLKGTLDVETQLPLVNPQTDLTVDLAGSVYLKAQAMGFSQERSHTLSSCRLYPQMTETMSLMSLDADGFSPVPRVQPARLRLMAFDMNAADEPVKANVYPYGQPDFITLADGQKLMVWVDDLPARSAANRTAILYSIYDGNSWSAPQTAADDGTADFSPRLCQTADGVFLVWQNADGVLPEGADMTQTAASLGISAAKFTGSGFGAVLSLTQAGDGFDSAPQVSANGSKLAVIWTKNSENDCFGMTGYNSILRKIYNGTAWESTQAIQEYLWGPAELAATWINGENIVAYSADTDSNLSTVYDRNIFLYHGAETTALPVGKGNITCPVFSGADLYWCCGGDIMTMKNLDTERISTVAEKADAFGLNAAINEQGGTLLYWLRANGFGTDVYGMTYDAENTRWSSPVTLAAKGTRVRDVKAILATDGSAELAYNSVALTGTDDAPYGQTDLIFSSASSAPDLIADETFFDDTQVVAGAPLTLHIPVKNTGLGTADSLLIELLDANDTLIQSKMENTPLLPGESGLFEMQYSLPESLTKHNIKVRVLPANGTDAAPENNITTLTIGGARIVLKKADVSRSFPNRTIRLTLQNKGYADTGTVMLILRDHEKIIFTDQIRNIAAQGESVITLNMPDSAFDYTGNTLVLSGNVTSQSGAGTDFGVLMEKMYPLDAAIGYITMNSESLDVETSVRNNTSDTQTTRLVLSVHDNQNTLRGIRIQSVSVPPGEQLLESHEVGIGDNYPGNCKIKMFLWQEDGTLTPLALPNVQAIN